MVVVSIVSIVVVVLVAVQLELKICVNLVVQLDNRRVAHVWPRGGAMLHAAHCKRELSAHDAHKSAAYLSHV